MNRAIGAIVLLVAANSVAAQQNALTEEEAINLGLSRGPIQQRAEGTISKAQSDILSASTRPNPEFSYELETLSDDSDLVEQKFILTQKFDFSGRRALNIQAAEIHRDAASLQSETWQADITKDIRNSFYSALYEQERSRAYERTQKRIDLLNKALTKRRIEGDVPIYDYQRVKMERASIAGKVRDAVVDKNKALQSLKVFIGLENGKYQSLQGTLIPSQPASLDALNESLETQPALLLRKKQSDAYAMQYSAESKTFPDVDLGLGYKRSDINDSAFDGIIINASIPIPVFDKREDKQARNQAEALVANSEYELARVRARADLQDNWQQLNQYLQNTATFRNDAVESADELIEISEAYYRAGEVGILELLDAYRGSLLAELTALELEYKARIARINIDHLTGGAAQ